MANSLSGVYLDAIAQETLEALLKELVQVKVFTTDFSNEIADAGQSVTTRVPIQPSTSSLGSTGYKGAEQAASTASVKVNLGDPQVVVVGFTDSEYSKSSINLLDIFIKPSVNAIADGMLSAALGCAMSSTVSTAVSGTFSAASNAAVFDSDIIVDVAEKLDANNVPQSGRFAFLGGKYFSKLLKDDAVKTASAFGGSEGVRKGIIPELFGFAPITKYGMPTNALKTVGLAGDKRGICIVSRTPAVPQNFPGEVSNVTDPESGITLQLRKWYSPDDGKHRLSCGIMYGAALGVKEALCRIVDSSLT